MLGTALATDTTLVAELESVRAATADASPATAVAASKAGRGLALWGLLIVMFLAIWQVLQPRPAKIRPSATDLGCQAQPECKDWGLCGARGSRCVAATDDDCQQSLACAKLGRCVEIGGNCVGRDQVGVSASPPQ